MLILSCLVANALLYLMSRMYNSWNKDKAYIILSFLLLAYVHSFVDINSVQDLIPYEYGFRECEKKSFWNILTNGLDDIKAERGFALLMKVSSLISSNYRFFLIFFSLIFFSLIYYSIKKYSLIPFLSISILLVDIFYPSTYTLRNYLAIAIFLYSFQSIINRNLKEFLLLYLWAVSIHQTAFFLLPIYFVYGIRRTKVLFLSLIMLSVITYVIFYYISFIISLYFPAYEEYADMDSEFSVTGVMYSVFLLVIYILLLKKQSYENGINKLLFIISIFAIIIGFTGINFSFTYRVLLYYTAPSIFMIPLIFKKIRNPLYRYGFLVIIFAILFYRNFGHNIGDDTSIFTIQLADFYF